MSAGELGAALHSKLRTVTWRQGTKAVLRSRFARIRVVVDREDGPLRPPQWLLIEWPEDEPAPTKYVLSTMPKSTSCKQLVHTFKERWRIERSYEDLKGELGLDHYEGRSYIGWHHHVSVVLACYAFLVAEHARSFPPSAVEPVAPVRSRTLPERHFHDSLVTLRILFAREVLVRWLPRCPACLREFMPGSRVRHRPRGILDQ
ncbi:MAG TPA: hypothetical protein VJR89_05640 [Polyangiales bacterium]|nr:hypothetical protein [Polyangiales bacterium]